MMLISRRRWAAFAFALLTCLPRPASAATAAVLWPRWEKHDDASTATIDHTVWAQFLGKYLQTDTADGINRVAYGAVTPQDRAAIEQDVKRQAAIAIDRYNSPEQRAYWTNLYNEMTVLIVLQHYPVASIRRIDLTPGVLGTPLFGSIGPWEKKLIRVEGVPISLDDIEHRILRPIWRDPRIHYALNCAALGCPELQPQPYTPADMDQLLDRGARAYVNSPRGAVVHDGKLTVSSIYVWYKADFGGTDHGVIAHLKRFADAPLAARLATVDHISGDHYDWALNDAPVAR